MKQVFATLSAIVALSAPVSAEAIGGIDYCIEKLPVRIEVQRGETLTSIARANYNGDISRYRDIARYNGIRDPDKIRVGQILELPGKTYEHQRLVSGADMLAGGYCR